MEPKLRNLQAIQTEDGSHTLIDGEQRICFRSTQGAKGESRHVFVGPSNLASHHGPWWVFELGFGAVRNCWETLQAFSQNPRVPSLVYEAVDYAPLSLENLRQAFTHEPIPDFLWHAFGALLQPGADRSVDLVWPDGRPVSLRLRQRHWRDVLEGNGQANVFYHDPFGAEDNPEAWTEACFRWAKSHLKPQGRLVTYAAAGHIRRAMLQAGFYVAKAPGFSRKREMTVAALDPNQLLGWKTIKAPTTAGEI